MRRTAISVEHRFVEEIPGELREGVVYVCVPFATVVHLCFCGCGHEVPTPLSPRDWRVTFDGETVSLAPSIGNWSLGCQSHYWIVRNEVRWAGQWTASQIAAARRSDLLDSYDGETADRNLTSRNPAGAGYPKQVSRFRSALTRLLGRTR